MALANAGLVLVENVEVETQHRELLAPSVLCDGVDGVSASVADSADLSELAERKLDDRRA